MIENFRNLHPVDRFSRVAVATCALFLTSVSAVVVTMGF
jgi:hypothetical protein